jgi:hypothetical protein
MDVSELIVSLDEDIQYCEKNLIALKNRRDKFSDLKNQFPNIQYDHGVFCLNDIWPRITCMRMERKHQYRPFYGRTIVARFSVGQKTLMSNIKMHSMPLNNVIATYNYRSKEILVNDYNTMIGNDCNKKSHFIRRIRIYLINLIVREKLILHPNSYDTESLEKLIMLA